jgi:hypothetical protein
MGTTTHEEDLMDARSNPSILTQATVALVLLAIALLLIRGISELVVLAVGTLSVTNCLVHRYA